MVKPPYNNLHVTTTASVPPPPSTIKFLCSYAGKILPRYPDGKLRYFGGHTRVLAVDRSISFPKLLLKLEDLCGAPMSLRCQLPTEDLDALVSVKSDEDLANLIEEYDRAASFPSLKIRAFLSTPRSASQEQQRSSSDASSPTSSSSSCSTSSPPAVVSSNFSPRFPVPVADRCIHQAPAPVMAFPFTSAGKVANNGYRAHHGRSNNIYFVHNANHRL